MMIVADFFPCTFNCDTGGSRRVGDIFIHYDDNRERRGEIRIRLTCSTPEWARDVGQSWFAAIGIHYDGIDLFGELNDAGFVAEFRDIQASTLYDVFRCLDFAGIPLRMHDGTHEFLNRKMYELLTARSDPTRRSNDA